MVANNHAAVELDDSGRTGQLYSRTLYQRLVIAACLRRDYHIRVEQRTRAGRTLIRILHPVELREEPGSGERAVLIARLVSISHQLAVPLAEQVELSIVTEHLSYEQVCRESLTVGDLVVHREYGWGIIEAFTDERDYCTAQVAFAATGLQSVDFPARNLRKTSRAQLLRHAQPATFVGEF